MGILMIGSNILIIIKGFIYIKRRVAYYDFSELFLYNLITCVFIFKRAKLCMAYTLFAVVILNLLNYSLKYDRESLDRVVTSLNGCIVTWCIMQNCQKESEENLQSK
uniref:Uncharacterized protein n=1 Tax=Euplotes harpa TaxID=151035 RepID=A0A7S3IYV4_9SPIT|mmetsp:Transcript_1043/g.1008  ORF Transcript_1043/g.1008 Transcript_1043/m.1008 type:complete len:107 (+) Transcript_1043:345-665(+)